MGVTFNLFNNKQQNSLIVNKDIKMKTTSNLLNLAAEITLNSLQESRGVSHTDEIQAVLLAAREGKFRKEQISKALAVLDLFIYDANGIRQNFGKTFTETRDPYAYDTVERNAHKRAFALKFAAEVAVTPIRVKVKLPKIETKDLAEKLERTSKKLESTKQRLEDVKAGKPIKTSVKKVKVAVAPDAKITLNPTSAWPFPTTASML
jgi:DNA repair exonuclease SbcCD ATPase subunit